MRCPREYGDCCSASLLANICAVYMRAFLLLIVVGIDAAVVIVVTACCRASFQCFAESKIVETKGMGMRDRGNSARINSYATLSSAMRCR